MIRRSLKSEKGATLREGRWKYHLSTAKAESVPSLKLRVPSDPRRTPMTCDKGLHTIHVRLENGTAHKWEVSREELEYWESLPTLHKSALIERQYEGCFVCNLDMEMR